MFDPLVPVPKHMLRRLDDCSWRREVDAVMSRFCRAFPKITYDIAWDVDAYNGVAWREMGQPHVRLYGGLLRHRAIRLEGIALVFAHETGHHYGGPPRDNIYTWMTTERQADYWAAHIGIKIAWGEDREGAERQIHLGSRQLLTFEMSMFELSDAEQKSHLLSRGNYDHPMPSERFEIYMGALDQSASRNPNVLPSCRRTQQF